MDWARFLPLARCPRCRSRLFGDARGASCHNAHAYSVSADGIPLFGPTRASLPEEQQAERRRLLLAQAARNDYAYLAIGRGHAESLYRTISEMLLRVLDWKRGQTVLVSGCSTGRCGADLAEFLPQSFVAGVDEDEAALSVARELLLEDREPLAVDLEDAGFGTVSLPRRNLPNLFLAQARLEALPLATAVEGGGFDAVLSVQLRLPLPARQALLASLVSILKPGGWLLVVDALPLASVRAGIERQGLAVAEAMDDLICRDLHHARGSYTERLAAIALARRPK